VRGDSGVRTTNIIGSRGRSFSSKPSSSGGDDGTGFNTAQEDRYSNINHAQTSPYHNIIRCGGRSSFPSHWDPTEKAVFNPGHQDQCRYWTTANHPSTTIPSSPSRKTEPYSLLLSWASANPQASLFIGSCVNLTDSDTIVAPPRSISYPPSHAPTLIPLAWMATQGEVSHV
jgi:hypothetical protein